jgi:hypothetical protein
MFKVPVRLINWQDYDWLNVKIFTTTTSTGANSEKREMAFKS